jgi:hypothetical protein
MKMVKIIKEIHNLYSLLTIVMIIKQRRRRWTGHVTCMEERRNP